VGKCSEYDKCTKQIQQGTKGERGGQKSDAQKMNAVVSTAQHITKTAVNDTAQHGYKFKDGESINKTFKIKTSESIPEIAIPSSCISRIS
jgi:hypothetical protein